MRAVGRMLNGLMVRWRWNLWRFNLRKLWTDVDKIEVDRPIFLLGTQGAGLTLLSRMLQRNPRVVNVWGGSRHWAGPDEMQVVVAPRLPDSLQLRGHPVLEDRGLGESWLYATDKLLPHFRKTPGDATPEQRELLLDTIRELLLLHVGKGDGLRFLDKSQSYTLKVAFLEHLLRGTDPHYVLVTRNPYATCFRAALKSLADHKAGHLERIQLAAEHWENSYRYALRDGSALTRLTLLRFEDLLADPEPRLRAVCQFLRLPFHRRMLPRADQGRPLGSSIDNKWYPLRREVNDTYLSELNTQEIELIRRRCGDLADRFGYTPGGP